jgi:hypothetical protein
MSIGTQVPTLPAGTTFNKFGEGISFDGALMTIAEPERLQTVPEFRFQHPPIGVGGKVSTSWLTADTGAVGAAGPTSSPRKS